MQIIILDSSNGSVYVFPLAPVVDTNEQFFQLCELHDIRSNDCQWMEFDGTIRINPKPPK